MTLLWLIPGRDIAADLSLGLLRWIGFAGLVGIGATVAELGPTEARRAFSASGSSSTMHLVLTPSLRRYGRSGARRPSIYLGREPNAATSVSDGVADVNLSYRSSL